MSLAPRAVLVHRATEYSELLAIHGTRGQAEFFLRTREQQIDTVFTRHQVTAAALQQVSAQVPSGWRRAAVERHDLPGFTFEPEDIVLVVGQDGLVANVAKYLTGQPVLGINPEGVGVLTPIRIDNVGAAALDASRGRATTLARTMVRARIDDGRNLLALNEIYLGHRSHQSARYQLTSVEGTELQSSSGVIVGSGSGSTGWLSSIAHDRGLEPGWLPTAIDPALVWFVREAWPSASTGTRFTAGHLATGQRLELRPQGPSLVCFGDGIESDALEIEYGQQVSIEIAEQRLITLQ